MSDSTNKPLKISASWIFNRLCDEPARLAGEINDQALTIRNGSNSMVTMLEQFQQKYHELLLVRRNVADMRMSANPEIEIANDTPYLNVTTTK